MLKCNTERESLLLYDDLSEELVAGLELDDVSRSVIDCARRARRSAIAEAFVNRHTDIMADLIRFRVRPVFHGRDLLIEILDDHRKDGFPNVASILRDALGATQIPHPEKLDDPQLAILHDRYFSYWMYSGGEYEIDDDVWGLVVFARHNNAVVVAEVDQALMSTGRFVKEPADFEEFR